MAQKVKVLIADDHRVVREGLTAILEMKDDIQIVGEAADGGEAVEKARTLMPDVIVMDVSMPGMGGGRGDPHHLTRATSYWDHCTDHV